VSAAVLRSKSKTLYIDPLCAGGCSVCKPGVAETPDETCLAPPPTRRSFTLVEDVGLRVAGGHPALTAAYLSMTMAMSLFRSTSTASTFREAHMASSQKFSL